MIYSCRFCLWFRRKLSSTLKLYLRDGEISGEDWHASTMILRLTNPQTSFLYSSIEQWNYSESPVLERFYLKTSSNVVIRNDLLAKRLLRELELVNTNPDRTVLTKAIYQHQTLFILRVECYILEDNYGPFYGNSISLRSLKVLQLIRVKYSSDVSLSNLLSSLPSLEDLNLDRCLSYHTTTLAIAVPCWKRLTVVTCPDSFRTRLMMLNVNTTPLNYLNVEDYWKNVSFADQKMENLIEEDVNVTYIDTEKLLTTLISAKRLSLCLVTSKIPRDSVFFDQLVRLEICTCQKEWWNLLERVLLYSPKLRVLKLHQKHCFGITDPKVRWKEPPFVPECFISHLETFEWRGYEGTDEEKKLASYILRNAERLKIATIYPLISIYSEGRPGGENDLVIIKELISMPKASTSCQLVIHQLNNFY